MNLSMKWLNEYVKTDIPPRDFCEGMSISGSKAEGYAIEGAEISGVVVGKVLSMEHHPDSDHLWICQIDIGTATVQIVTGAQNVAVGDFVPVATDGAKLPGGIKIKKGKLRGVESCGMLCSLGELQLAVSDFPYAIEDGIFILGDDCDCTIGADIHSAVGIDDTVVEFEITSNRPDCLSVRGLAREVGATFTLPITLPTPVVKSSGGDVNEYLSVSVENTELCSRYMAAVVKNAKIEPSPRWMRERLRASGVRAINNFVDITNYVMLEFGHPMHAFDLKYVADSKIVVRNAKEGETIITLDETERALSPEMLVIADGEKPSAVAGVMGGDKSGIDNDTEVIVFEAACFQGTSVRTTSKKLGMRTESSGRFEKGLDSRTCELALARACELVELLGAGEVVSGVIDVDNDKKEPVNVPFDPDATNVFLGTNITRDEMAALLKPLDIELHDGYVTVPTYRADLEHKADIAEEVARIYGYNKISTTALVGVAEGKLTAEQKFARDVTNTMLALGCSEAITYSFISPKFYDKMAMPSDDKLRNSVEILNPLGEDTSIMRTTAIPSMLDILARNYNNRNLDATLFEIAREYIPTEQGKLPIERNVVMLGAYGKNCDFFTVKGIVENLLAKVGVENARFTAQTENPTFHPGRCATIAVDGKEIGVIGEVHPIVVENFGLAQRTYIAQLSLELLFELANTDKIYKALPKFPASTRDIAVICEDTIPVADIADIIVSTGGKLLEHLELFDVYRGEQVGEGKKSVAYALTLRAADRTLTVEECDKIMGKIIVNLEKIGANIRK